MNIYIRIYTKIYYFVWIKQYNNKKEIIYILLKWILCYWLINSKLIIIIINMNNIINK